MRMWVTVLQEWEKYQKNTHKMRPIWRKTNNGATLTINYKQAVNLNTIDVTGLLQSVHSTIVFHSCIQLLSLQAINLNGNVNFFVTFRLLNLLTFP